MLTSFTVLALIFPKFLKMVSALSKSSHRPIPHPSSRFIETFEGVESAEKHERRRKEGQTKGKKKKKEERGKRKKKMVKERA